MFVCRCVKIYTIQLLPCGWQHNYLSKMCLGISQLFTNYDTLVGPFGTLCGDQLSCQLLLWLRCLFWLRSGNLWLWTMMYITLSYNDVVVVTSVRFFWCLLYVSRACIDPVGSHAPHHLVSELVVSPPRSLSARRRSLSPYRAGAGEVWPAPRRSRRRKPKCDASCRSPTRGALGTVRVGHWTDEWSCGQSTMACDVQWVMDIQCCNRIHSTRLAITRVPITIR